MCPGSKQFCLGQYFLSLVFSCHIDQDPTVQSSSMTRGFALSLVSCNLASRSPESRNLESLSPDLLNLEMNMFAT